MDELTSPQGAVALAIAALLLVVGYRLARPDRGREWLAIALYAAALAALLLGARGMLPGPALAAGPALRIAGAALVVGGLVVAGKPSRDRRRAAATPPARPTPGPLGPHPPAVEAAPLTWVGLALVVVGQLARSPSVAGAVVTAAAVLVLAAVAAASRR
jgi:hypothetical protein